MRSASILSLLLASIVVTNALKFKSLISQNTARLAEVEAQQTGFKPGMLIPLYIYPTVDGSSNCNQADFVKVATSAIASRTIAVINVNSGPRGSNNAEENLFRACINYLRSNGVKVAGYVHTKLGWPGPINAYRSYSLATADIDYWYANYTVDGIFLDETSGNWPQWTSYDSEAKLLEYYGNLTTYITGKNSQWNVIFNPGTVYKNALVNGKGGNVKAVVYENDASKWSPASPATCASIQRDNLNGSSGVFPKGPWCVFVPTWDDIEQVKDKMDNGTILPTQSSAMLYSVPNSSTDVQQIIADGVSQKIGWFYLTNLTPAQGQWNSLPSSTVWDAMVNKLNSY